MLLLESSRVISVSDEESQLLFKEKMYGFSPVCIIIDKRAVSFGYSGVIMS